MFLTSLITSLTLMFANPTLVQDKETYNDMIELSFDQIRTEHIKQENAQIKEDFILLNDVLITHYDALCNTGCSGITATGIDVRHNITLDNGYGVVAVDPNVIPLHSIVIIDGKTYQAEDTGGAIDGKHIDVLVESRKIARELGKTHKDVRIIKPNH